MPRPFSPSTLLQLLKRRRPPASSAIAVRLSLDAMDPTPETIANLERDIVFVRTLTPPRVGRKVELTLVADRTELPALALVLWSKTPRPGVVAGFGARLEKPPREVHEALLDLAAALQVFVEQHPLRVRRSLLDEPVREVVRAHGETDRRTKELVDGVVGDALDSEIERARGEIAAEEFQVSLDVGQPTEIVEMEAEVCAPDLDEPERLAARAAADALATLEPEIDEPAIAARTKR